MSWALETIRFTQWSRVRGLKTLAVLLFLAFPGIAQSISVDPQALEQAIQVRRQQVGDFNLIVAEAKRRGLRVFLAGGYAASYGDFIKHQLLAEQGKMRIQPNRLDPVSANITLPEQDLDLVLTRADGKPEAVEDIREFKQWLDTNLPRTLDGKSLWDVNGLKTAQGSRPAWSGDLDFARQNNDSLSIGLIELTEPPAGTSVVHEAHHFAKAAGKASIFLEDLAGDEVHFLHSTEHALTTRAQKGTNPEILGAVRVLTKVFQFDKDLKSDDLKEVAKIIRKFDPTQVEHGSYVDTWLKTRGKRLITHAYAPDLAITMLDHLGLREKLILLGGRSWDPLTISWWMNKVPLPSLAPTDIKSPLPSVTAGELGITKVDHVTHPEAERLITWRYDGVPRAFVSRENTPGETAVHGPGFYTNVLGRRAFGTTANGAVIEFNVDPKAREGIDFRLVGNNGEGVLWLNGAHLEAIHPRYESSEACKNLAQRLSVNLAAVAGAAAPGQTSSKVAGLFAKLRETVSLTVFGTIVTVPIWMPAYIGYIDHVREKAFEKFTHGTPEEATAAYERLLQMGHFDGDPHEYGKLVSSGNRLIAERSINILGNASPKNSVVTVELLRALREPNPHVSESDRKALQQALFKALKNREFSIYSIGEFELNLLADKDEATAAFLLELIDRFPVSERDRLHAILARAPHN